MSSDRIVAVPPSAKSSSPSLLALGKIWSVITLWPWSAKTSTEDQSTRMRRRTRPLRAVSGARWTVAAKSRLKSDRPDRVRST